MDNEDIISVTLSTTTTTLFGLLMDESINMDSTNVNSSINDSSKAFPKATLASIVTSPDHDYENSTESPQPTRPSNHEAPSAILTGIVLYILVLITLVGNIFVLLAVYIEKSLQTAFNFFIVNLAITDTCVAATAMSFYATGNTWKITNNYSL